MILCSSGLYISYQLSLYSIRQQQKEIILHSEIFKGSVFEFSFSRDYIHDKDIDLVFVEDDEIMFNGKMYDIVSQQKSADSIFIKCIPDKIEDEIREEVNNQINNTKGTATQKNFSAFKFNPGPFTIRSETENLLFISKNKSASFLFLKNDTPVAQYINVASPPPWKNV